MRYLTIVRHAKAEKPAVGQSDFDRALTERGQRQSAQLREWAKDPAALGAYGPATALVSAAQRTRETYALGFAGTNFVHAMETSELIYNGHRHVSGEDLLAELAAIDPVTESLLVVGHNPTVLELALLLAPSPPPDFEGDRFPTGTAMVFALNDEPIGLRHYPFVTSFVPID
jgi:phosphohistidine phosphatase